MKKRKSSQTKVRGAKPESVAAVGFTPLSPEQSLQDYALFKAFQSNLLSLISHELRTPLTTVLNSLNVLHEGVVSSSAVGSAVGVGGLSSQNLIQMAYENAVKLNQALTMLFDLASLETGALHLVLREAVLRTLVQSRLPVYEQALARKKVKLRFEEVSSPKEGGLAEGVLPEGVLVDVFHLRRALDLCFQVLIPRVISATEVSVRVSSTTVEVRFDLVEGMEKQWETAWSQSLAEFYAGGVASVSVFAGVLQTEDAFLARSEEGFGNEFLLIHEIMRLHQGSFKASLEGGSANNSAKNSSVTLQIVLPQLTTEEGLHSVLKSRIYRLSSELGSVTLILVEDQVGGLKQKIKENLLRSRDAVYGLPQKQQVAMVLEDCQSEDAARVMRRIEKILEQGGGKKKLRYGIVHAPSDGLDPEALIRLGNERLLSR